MNQLFIELSTDPEKVKVEYGCERVRELESKDKPKPKRKNPKKKPKKKLKKKA